MCMKGKQIFINFKNCSILSKKKKKDFTISQMEVNSFAKVNYWRQDRSVCRRLSLSKWYGHDFHLKVENSVSFDSALVYLKIYVIKVPYIYRLCPNIGNALLHC